MVAYCASCRRREDENALLRERLTMLASVFENKCISPVAWGLSPQQRRLFATLSANQIASRDQLMATLYWDRENDAADDGIVDVQISKMRSKIAPFGVTIKGIYGLGWSMTMVAESQGVNRNDFSC